MVLAEARRVAWTAKRAAEERDARVVSAPKRSLAGSKERSTLVLCIGKEWKGPRARAARAPFARAVWMREGVR